VKAPNQHGYRASKESGAELVRGELRDSGSLAVACRGVATVVSGATTITALGTDSISAVDRQTIELGGAEAVTPLEVIERVQSLTGRALRGRARTGRGA
jgi:hypothetical protein